MSSSFRQTFLGAHIGSEKFVKRVAGKTDLEDGLKKLDILTNEEVVMAVAQLLKITHNIDNKVTRVGDGVKGVDEKVQVVGDNVKVIDDVVQTIADGGPSVFSLLPASSLTFFLTSRWRGSKGNDNESEVHRSANGGQCE